MIKKREFFNIVEKSKLTDKAKENLWKRYALTKMPTPRNVD
jgi:hypothetical protein